MTESGLAPPLSCPDPQELAAAMERLIFSKWDQRFLATKAGARARDHVLFGRYDDARRFAAPWLDATIGLGEQAVVELGSGSGSTTAALAQRCRSIVGYEVDADAASAARARCAAYGLDNATVEHADTSKCLAHVSSRTPRATLYVLFAVLEHQTYDERLHTLRSLWEALEPGGHLALMETPNRLSYFDSHTSNAPFYHWLPDALALRYVERLPDSPYRRAMQGSADATAETRIRWGIGVSFHELELAIAEPLDEIVVADGYEPEICNWLAGEPLDEELLQRYFLARVRQPMAFTRNVLNLVLRKPAHAEHRNAAAYRNAKRRADFALRLGWRPGA